MTQHKGDNVIDIKPDLWERRYRELEITFKGLEQELKSTKIMLEVRKRESEDLRRELKITQNVGKMLADTYNGLERITDQIMMSHVLLSQTLANKSMKEESCQKQSEN